MICQQIIAEGKLENIHQIHILSPEAARILIQHEKRMELLSLGITELSPDVAEELAQYKGEKLYLNCVTELSADTAKAIARFKGIKLMLNGLRNVSYQVLGRLASYQGILHLDGIESFEICEDETRRVQTIFQNLECTKLSMNGLKNPNISLIKALALCRGQLDLNSIKDLAPEESAILGEHPGKGLALKGIKTLSNTLLKLFTKYVGFLDLSGAQVVENDFLYLVASRPEQFSLFSGPVKRRIEVYKAMAIRERMEMARETNKIQRLELEQKRDSDQEDADMFAEFEKFDDMELQMAAELAKTKETEKPDPYGPEIADSVVKDIELNLNKQIDAKKKQMAGLLQNGFSALTESERTVLGELRDQIEKLKGDIRGALDILVEKKELGAIVFTSSHDLAAYLKQSGEGDDENDALADIENADLFGDSFAQDETNDSNDSNDSEETMDEESSMAMMDMWGDSSGLDELKNESIEGNDFIISDV